MSKASDATIELLKRQGYLPADYGLKPDYGGPTTALETVDEFLQDALGNITGGLIPKANPYGRMSADQRRQYDASRAADLATALKDQQEALLAKQKADIEEQNRKTREQNREDSAFESQNVIDFLREVEQSRADSALQQIRTAGEVSTEQSIKQMQELLPYVDASTARAIERNLDASKRFKAFKEQLPSSIQAIMESKQRQQQLASDAFAREAGAIASQQQAATGFAGVGTGRRFG